LFALRIRVRGVAGRLGGRGGGGIGHQYVFRLGAVDQVAEAPAGRRLVAVAAAQALRHQVAAVLRGRAILGGIGIEVGADGAGDHALAFPVAGHGAAGSRRGWACLQSRCARARRTRWFSSWQSTLGLHKRGVGEPWLQHACPGITQEFRARWIDPCHLLT